MPGTAPARPLPWRLNCGIWRRMPVHEIPSYPHRDSNPRRVFPKNGNLPNLCAQVAQLGSLVNLRPFFTLSPCGLTKVSLGQEKASAWYSSGTKCSIGHKAMCFTQLLPLKSGLGSPMTSEISLLKGFARDLRSLKNR
jgi:hypothetical protein